MKLDEHIKALIAVGASLAANCQPCLKSAVGMALESGADQQEIAEAIEVAKRVRRGATSKMDEFALALTRDDPLVTPLLHGECGCSATAEVSNERK